MLFKKKVVWVFFVLGGGDCLILRRVLRGLLVLEVFGCLVGFGVFDGFWFSNASRASWWFEAFPTQKNNINMSTGQLRYE